MSEESLRKLAAAFCMFNKDGTKIDFERTADLAMLGSAHDALGLRNNIIQALRATRNVAIEEAARRIESENFSDYRNRGTINYEMVKAVRKLKEYK